MTRNVVKGLLTAASMLLGAAGVANAAIVRADFTVLIDQAIYGGDPSDPSCITSSVSSGCIWTSLVGQQANGYFLWDSQTDSLGVYGAPNRYTGMYSVTIPLISFLPMPVGFFEGGLRLSDVSWLVGGTNGDLQTVSSSLSIVPGGVADGTFTPAIDDTLFSFRVSGTTDSSQYHCPISAYFPDAGRDAWVLCNGSGHLTSLDVHVVDEPPTLGLAAMAFVVLAATRRRRPTRAVVRA